MRTKNWNIIIAASAATIAGALIAPPSFAQQSAIEFSICDQTGCPWPTENGTYFGVGSDALFDFFGDGRHGVALEAQSASVWDAYDNYGYIFGASAIPNDTAFINSLIGDRYATQFNGLTANRRTETYATEAGLPANSIRWFDSFTNNTASSIVANIGFGGNLGSDSGTYIHAQGDGYLVTGDSAPGNLSGDPVIVHLYGNNDYAAQNTSVLFAAGNDNVLFFHPLTVAPGETVSLMHLNILFGAVGRHTDAGGVLYAQDVAEAINAAKLFVNDPIFAGLTAAQIETIINWGNIVVDGTLPAASSAAGFGQSMLGAFAGIIDRAMAIDTSTFTTSDLVVGALAYNAQSDVDARSPGSAALARALGDAGGRVATHRTYDSQAYLFGGYTTGFDRFTAGTFNYAGYAIGAGLEYSPATSLTLGVAGGYAFGSGSMATVYPDLDSSQYVLSPYARWTAPTGTILDARLMASVDGFEYLRTAGVDTASAKTRGHSLGAKLAVSQPFETELATIAPYASLSHLHSFVKGYQETGAGNANLNVASYSLNSLEAFAGIGFSKDWTASNGTVLKGFVRGGVGGNLLGNDTVVTSYTTSPTTYLNVLENGKDVFGQVETGVAARFTERVSVSATYGATFSRSSSQHTVMSTLTARF